MIINKLFKNQTNPNKVFEIQKNKIFLAFKFPLNWRGN